MVAAAMVTAMMEMMIRMATTITTITTTTTASGAGHRDHGRADSDAGTGSDGSSKDGSKSAISSRRNYQGTSRCSLGRAIGDYVAER